MTLASSAASLPAVLIEAFTSVACSGNGAAVVRLESPQPGRWMQALAGSLRQSETAFLLPCGEGWLLRWFTPACEVPLCGHATLASLLALAHWGSLPASGRTCFHTRSGPLEVALEMGPGHRGSLLLPGGDLLPAPPCQPLEELLHRQLGCGTEAFWTSELGYRVGLLPACAPLADLRDPAAHLPEAVRKGLVLMQSLPSGPEGEEIPRLGGESADYQLRFFAPAMGIDEDPVTGSAHSLVAPYWMKLRGRRRVVGWQCSDRPGGMVCEAASSGMIRLTGSGHLLWDGTLRAQPPNGEGPSGFGSQPVAHAWQSWLDLDSELFPAA